MEQTNIDRVLAFSLPLYVGFFWVILMLKNLKECTNYALDDRFLEYSHDYVHYFINGDMKER